MNESTYGIEPSNSVQTEEIEQRAQLLASQIGSEYFNELQRYMTDDSYREECLKKWRTENPNFDKDAAAYLADRLTAAQSADDLPTVPTR